MNKRKSTKTTTPAQKGLALFLAVIMLLGVLPGTVFAVTVDGTEPAGTEAPVASTPATEAPDGTTAPSEPEGTTAPSAPEGTTAPSAPEGTTAPSVPEGTTAPSVPEGTTAPSVPEGTTAPSVPEGTTAPSVPEGTTAPSVPEGTTAPSVPEGTTPSDKGGLMMSPPPKVPTYEDMMEALTALEEEAKTLEATLEVLDEFAARLRDTWNLAYDLNEAGKISDEELENIDAKASAILAFLKSEYGYENGVIQTLENYLEGLTAVNDLGGRSFHIILQNDTSLALTDEISRNNNDSFTGFKANIDANNTYYATAVGKLNVANLTRWQFVSTGASGEYYVKNEATGKYMDFRGEANTANRGRMSDTPVATKVYSYTYTTTEDEVEKTYQTYILTQTLEGSTYVLNQLGGRSATDFNVFGGFVDDNAYCTDIGNLFLLKETYTPADEKPVPSVKENITMSLFDYGPLINGQTGELDFMHGAYKTDALDGHPAAADGNGGKAPLMEKMLVNGYPKTVSDPVGLSYQYLFDPSKATINEADYWANIYPENDVNVSASPYQYRMATFPIDNADGSGTGLFQKDSNGYYYYDSLLNAAWYNPDTNKFILYDYVVRPPYTDYSGTTTATVSNFTPFSQGHIAGYEDYGTYEVANPNRPDGEKKAYRLAGVSQKTDMNNWFGMALEFDFNMPTGGLMNGNPMEFRFHGDDDVYVYIDGILILDIGGTHGAQSASINFANGKVTNPGEFGTDGKETASMANRLGSGTLYYIMKSANPGLDDSLFVDVDGDKILDTFKDWTQHNLKFFYMERGGNISYCQLQFNMEPLPKGNVQVTKELSNEAVSVYGEEIEFEFTLSEKKDTGNAPVANTPYTITNRSGGQVTGTTGSNGKFTLKAGETAYFSDLESKHTYIVEETAKDRTQLVDVKYNGTIIYNGTTDTENEGFYIDPNRPNDLHALVFTNTLDDTAFQVAKTVKGNMGDRNKDFEFTAELHRTAPGTDTHINFPEPGENDVYQLNEEGNAVFTLKHGEAGIIFDDIPLGAYVVITETAVDGYETANDNGEGVKATVKQLLNRESEPVKVTFTNTKNVTIDTGIALDSMPYILILVGVLAVGSFLFLRRRRSFED